MAVLYHPGTRQTLEVCSQFKRLLRIGQGFMDVTGLDREQYFDKSRNEISAVLGIASRNDEKHGDGTDGR